MLATLPIMKRLDPTRLTSQAVSCSEVLAVAIHKPPHLISHTDTPELANSAATVCEGPAVRTATERMPPAPRISLAGTAERNEWHGVNETSACIRKLRSLQECSKASTGLPELEVKR
jgi:hypothetical protein